ncbi:MAG: hypothetical protein H7039_22915 [Bryobacteraceae bacterium]|nr:hypothetical protein [Bryobacteraceae bacterium]
MSSATLPTQAGPVSASLSVLWLMVLVPLGVISYGLIYSGVLLQPVWTSGGLQLLILFATGYALTAAAVFLVRARALGAVCALVALLFAIISVGAGAVATLIAFLAASQVVGDVILKDQVTQFGEFADAGIRLTTGMAVYVCLTGLLVYVPVNYPSLYWVLILAPVVARWRSIRQYATLWTQCLVRGPGRDSPGAWAAGALLGFFLLAHLVVALKPEVSFDGLSMHLYVSAFVSANHYWPFDTAQVTWAAMPMAGDWAYTCLHILGGEDAARLLNFAVLTILASLLVALGGSIAGRTTGLLLATAFLSSPVVQLVTGSMFIDNFLALWLFASLTIVVVKVTNIRTLYAGAVLLGTAAQTKFGSLPAVVILGAFLIAALYRVCRESRKSFAIYFVGWGILLLAAGIPPYLTAWTKTRNPLYPIAVPILSTGPGVLQQTPFHEPLKWTSLYDLTFDSGRYLESQNGSLGLHYLILIPLGAAACLLVCDRACRIALAVALFSSIVIYLGSANIRYLYPTLPLFVIAAASAFPLIARHSKLLTSVVLTTMSVLALLNLYLLPASGWYHKQFFLPDITGKTLRQQYMRAFRPIAPVTEYLNLAAHGSPVAFLGTNQIGGLAAVAYTLTWHHAPFRARIETAGTGREVLDTMRGLGITWFAAPEMTHNLPRPVQQFLSDYTIPAFGSGGWQARQLTSELQYQNEVLTNGEFDSGVVQWSVFGAVPVDAGAVKVNQKNTISQSFVAQPGVRYLYALTAVCPVMGTQLRLQVNWIDKSGAITDVSLEPVSCGPASKVYSTKLIAPPGAAAGVAIVGGHDGNTVVVERASLRR